MNHSIDTVIWDADNTLWDWMGYAVPAYEAMCQKLAELSGRSNDETAEAMRAFYTTKGTLEDEGLVQGLESWGFFERMENFDRDATVLMLKNAFSEERDKNLRLYPGIFQAVVQVRARVQKQIIVTDATGQQAPRRLLRSGLSSYFSEIHSMPKPEVRDIPSVLKRDLDLGHVVHHSLQTEKPNIDLETILGMTRDEIKKRVAIIGDSDAKDMGMARKYECFGLHAVYGLPKPELIKRLLRFAPESAARRNTSLGSAEERENSRIIPIHNPSEILGRLFPQ